MPFAEPEQLDDELSRLDELLATFDSSPARPTGRRRRGRRSPTPARPRARSSRGGPSATTASAGMTRAGRDSRTRSRESWSGAASAGMSRRSIRTPPRYIEAPWEIERLLELSDVGVCLDTGHLLLGGGDPVAAVRAWGERINHLHLKDARLDVLRGSSGTRRPSRRSGAARRSAASATAMSRSTTCWARCGRSATAAGSSSSRTSSRTRPGPPGRRRSTRWPTESTCVSAGSSAGPSGSRGISRKARGRRRGTIIAGPRGVAQSGSAPGWGPGGRRFKSCLPD